MIDYSEVRRIIEVYIDENFDTVPVQFENIIIDVDGAYISLTDIQANAQPPAMGSKTSLITGIIVIQIYTVYGTGTVYSRNIASELANLLLGNNVEGVKFKAPTLTSIGKVDQADYYQQNFSIEYEFIYN